MGDLFGGGVSVGMGGSAADGPVEGGRGRTLTVALNASTADEPLDGSDVEAAVDYWNDRGGVNGTTLEYVGTGPAPDADVVVEGTPYIRWCGTSGRGRVVGCTWSVVSGDRLVGATVEVDTTENESVVDLTLKHELGHVLGLEHGELPEEVDRVAGPAPGSRGPIARSGGR